MAKKKRKSDRRMDRNRGKTTNFKGEPVRNKVKRTNKYDESIKNEAKFLYVEKQWDVPEIYRYLNGPSENTLRNWVKDPDPKTRKTWKDLRKERADTKYLEMSPANMAQVLLKRLHELLHNDDIDTVRLSDAMYKILKSIERLTDPGLQVPVMYHMLQEYVLYTKANFPGLVNNAFLESVRAFKNHVRGKLENDLSGTLVSSKNSESETPAKSR